MVFVKHPLSSVLCKVEKYKRSHKTAQQSTAIAACLLGRSSDNARHLLVTYSGKTIHPNGLRYTGLTILLASRDTPWAVPPSQAKTSGQLVLLASCHSSSPALHTRSSQGTPHWWWRSSSCPGATLPHHPQGSFLHCLKSFYTIYSVLDTHISKD